VKPTPLNIDESEEGELNIEDEDGTSLTFWPLFLLLCCFHSQCNW
jgi:hypothetical protein